jgi:hypothetical protein
MMTRLLGLWPWLGLTGLLCLMGLVGWTRRQPRSWLPPCENVVYKNGVYQFTVDVAKLKKNIVRLGSGQVEIVLDGDHIPQVAAQIVGQPGEHGQRQAVWEVLDPEDPSEVLERYILEHDDAHFIGEYKIVFKQYQTEASFVEGSLNYE